MHITVEVVSVALQISFWMWGMLLCFILYCTVFAEESKLPEVGL